MPTEKPQDAAQAPTTKGAAQTPATVVEAPNASPEAAVGESRRWRLAPSDWTVTSLEFDYAGEDGTERLTVSRVPAYVVDDEETANAIIVAAARSGLALIKETVA